MNNAEFLIETNIQEILKYYISDTGLSIMEAMRSFYTSEVFEKLQQKETGLYLESPAYVYDLFKNEICNGVIYQDEI